MRRRLGVASRLLGAAAVVFGALACLGLIVGLVGGGVGSRSVAMAAVGVALAAAAMRLVDRHRLLGGYSALVFLLLFIPIIVVVVYAFNANRIVALWDGFSTKWFSVALERQDYRDAIWRRVAVGAGRRAQAPGSRSVRA